MKRLDWSSLSPVARAEALARPKRRRDPEVAAVVRRIFDDVEAEGWEAVRRWGMTLDRQTPRRFEVSPAVAQRAGAALTAEDLCALELAADNVRRFHEATRPQTTSVEVRPGVTCRREWRAVETAGLYVPGGSAPLFSTLIMLAEPARVAGVPKRIVVTPPDKDGAPRPIMVAAAAACALDELWLVGGAQAIAALALGAGLAKADKILGPGNVYVAEAKRYAASLPGGPAIDLPAGPSELLVIADAAADADLVAVDLLSQAEHDADAQVLLVSPSARLIGAVEQALAQQTASLPRADIVSSSLSEGRIVQVRDLAEAAAVANLYAPEHLSLQIADPESLLPHIANAGAVFMGAYSAEAFGDYICGPSHVLPTDGAARAWSGVSVASFMKSLSVQQLDRDGARALTAATARLARLEGLEAHARAAEKRGRP